MKVYQNNKLVSAGDTIGDLVKRLNAIRDRYDRENKWAICPECGEKVMRLFDEKQCLDCHVKEQHHIHYLWQLKQQKAKGNIIEGMV